jgi:hypothetical protein
VNVAGEEPVLTDAAGAFRVEMPETADLLAGHAGYLGAEAVGVACNGADVVMAPIRLPAGDINSDARVDVLDLTAVAASYGACSDGADFNPRADLNESGCTDMLDLVLLGSSYQVSGPLPWSPEPSNGQPEVPSGVSFAGDVDPILQSECRLCHGDAGGLSFKSYDTLMSGGREGPVVVAGDPESSSLYTRLIGAELPAMPPGGVSLPEHEIDVIRAWIAEGAVNN